MASNLRDKGYPSAKEYKPPKKVYKNDETAEHALMTDDITYEIGYDSPETIKRKSNRPTQEKNLGDFADVFNFMTKASPYVPRIADYGYVDTNEKYEPVGYNYGLVYQHPITNQKGFINHHFDNRDSTYSGTINGLNSLLGDNTFKGALTTLAGLLNYGYDGDVLFGSLKRANNDYYIRALKNMLDKEAL